jgi:hypothetical protein
VSALSTGDLFVVGAGFSKAVSHEMPLTNELFSRTHRKMQQYHLEGAEDVTEMESFKQLGQELELWLTYLAEDQPWLNEASNLRNRALFADFSLGIAGAILECQNAALRGDCPDWFTALVNKWHDDRSVVITLNYDTLIERALSTKHAVPDATFYVIPTPPLPSKFAPAMPDTPTMETVQLYKLHGSINWYFSGFQKHYGEPIYNIGLRRGWSNGPDSDSEIRNRAGARLPVVVPPVLSKSAYLDHPSLREQWMRAHAALSGVTKLHILGYSLPLNDQMMRFFLSATPPNCVVVPVDVNDAIVSRLQQALPGRPMITSFVGSGDCVHRFVLAYTRPQEERIEG